MTSKSSCCQKMKQLNPRGPIHMNLFHLGHSDESGIGGRKSNEGCPEGLNRNHFQHNIYCFKSKESDASSSMFLCYLLWSFMHILINRLKHIDSWMQKRLNSSAETVNILSQLVSVLVTIGTDNGLLPVQHQAITWTNADLQSVRPWRTYFNKILFETREFSFKEMHLKLSSAKRKPFYLRLNILTVLLGFIHTLSYQ